MNRRPNAWSAAALIGLLGALPALAAPDCKDTCDAKAKDIYDECILMGGSPLGCQFDSNEFVVDCYSRCPKAEITFPLVMCVEMEFDTQDSVGIGFPWENSMFFFSTYRNQYLYPSNTLADVLASGVTTIETIHARSVSFAGSSINVYGNFSAADGGGPSTVSIYDTSVGNLGLTFADNIDGPLLGRIESAVDAPMVIATMRGVSGSHLSTCLSCADGDSWFEPIDVALAQNILVDTKLAVSPFGNSGSGVWDATTSSFGQGCVGPERAYGSGSFANADHLTTALGIDDSGFVWVFAGKAPGKSRIRFEDQLTVAVEMLLSERDQPARALGSLPEVPSRSDGLGGVVRGDGLVMAPKAKAR